MDEIISARTLNTKVWQIDSTTFKKRFSNAPLHYFADGEFKDIDLSPSLIADQYLIDKAAFALRVDIGTPAYLYTNSIGKSVSVEFIPKGAIGNPVYNEDRVFVWKNVDTDTDYQIIPTKKGISTAIVLHSDKAAKEWSWEIIGDTELIKPVVGYDAKGRFLQLETSNIGDVLTVSWNGRTTSANILRDPKDKIWTKDVDYPVVIDPSVNETPTTAYDDVISINGNVYLSQRTNVSPGMYQGNLVYAGLLFHTIAIPQGATVTEASLTFDVTSIVSGPVTVNIYGNDVDDAGIWSPLNHPVNITKTLASAQMNGSATGYSTVGVTGIVQEIFDRTGWSTSNDMAFGLFPDLTATAGTHIVRFAAFEHTTRQEVNLDITYSTESGGTQDSYVKPRFLKSRFTKTRFLN